MHLVCQADKHADVVLEGAFILGEENELYFCNGLVKDELKQFYLNNQEKDNPRTKNKEKHKCNSLTQRQHRTPKITKGYKV